MSQLQPNRLGRQWLHTKLDLATMTFANMNYCCFSHTSKECPTYMNGYERYECLISSINWPAMDWRLLMWLVMSLGIKTTYQDVKNIQYVQDLQKN